MSNESAPVVTGRIPLIAGLYPAGFDTGGGTHWLFPDVFQYGGFRSCVNTVERDGITTARRKEGMLIYVISTNKYFRMGSGLTNGDWVEVQIGGSGLDPLTNNLGYAWIDNGNGTASWQAIRSSFIQAAFDITGFFTSGGQSFEVGQVVSGKNFTASYNRVPTTASLSDSEGNPAINVVSTPTAFSTAANYTKTSNNAAVIWTLTADENGSGDNAVLSAFWRPRAFYGAAVSGTHNESFIEGLASNQLAASRNTTIVVNAGVNQHIYYGFPASYDPGDNITFTVGGFSGGFEKVADPVSVTNAFGVTQNYKLWRSANTNLGSTTVVIT